MNFTETDKNIARHAMEYALANGCREVKTILSAGMENEVEWRDGKITTLNSSQSRRLTMALYFNGRYSTIYTNRIEQWEIERFIRQGIENTGALAEDPCRQLPPENLCYKGKADDMGLYDNGYFDVDTDSRINAAQNAVSEINDSRVIAASGMEDDYLSCDYILTSNGFEAEIRRSSFAVSAETSVLGSGDERPEAFAYAVNPHWHKLPEKGIGSEALNRALNRIGAKRIASGKYSVVVDRRVSAQLFEPIVSALKAMSIYQKSSFLLDRKDTVIASDRLTVVDNPLQPGKIGACYFDKECIALKPMTLIEHGVLKNYYVSHYMSLKSGMELTHNDTTVIDFAHDGIDTPALLTRMGNGVYITGFNGGNCNVTTGDFSYGIEGFEVRNGIIAEPVAEMLVTGNMLDLWSKLVLVSNDPLYNSSWNIGSLLFYDIVLN